MSRESNWLGHTAFLGSRKADDVLSVIEKVQNFVPALPRSAAVVPTSHAEGYVTLTLDLKIHG
jgi:hypothetical protein